MPQISRQDFVRAIAEMTGLSIPAAAFKVTDVCAELELDDYTQFSERTAGEIEAIIIRDLRASKS